MSSKKYSINKLHWDSPVLGLSGTSSPSQSLLKLKDAGFEKVQDLLTILPLRVQEAPKASSFANMREGELFLGAGELINAQFVPAFGRKGKGRVQLFNATLTVQDKFSDGITTLKVFNAYPNLKKNLQHGKNIEFMGKAQSYKGSLQIVNPNLNPKNEEDSSGLLIEYPTVATVAGKFVKKIIDKIPDRLWEDSPSLFNTKLRLPVEEKNLGQVFALIHGRIPGSKAQREEAYQSLVYREFFEDQLKIMARRRGIKSKDAPVIPWERKDFEQALALFPYELTEDQISVLNQIEEDFLSGSPMMRMVQGDVGCGKTTVALVSAVMIWKNGGQTALMCPTESLALQHYQAFKKDAPHEMKIELLLGSHKPSEKKRIYERLHAGEIDIIIGTHSLIQEKVRFHNLEFVIIDEQHKFGVEQRQRLSFKREGAHTLIMTATPIPRTLQLAQYGDLDISTIKTMPKGRAGVKTRIVNPSTYEKYLSFVKTRLSLGEQVYVVAPAIEESETLDIKNVKEIESFYLRHFPEYKIKALHGKLKPDEKQEIFQRFGKKEIDMLVSTSVVEVGINVVNATVMSVYNPDRFGLSSLHQLRGRVGRGEKPGFFFLVTDKKLSGDTLSRLKVIERSSDGFEIAEADLKNRGQGDLFGLSQSGTVERRRFASIFEHFDIFDQVNRDLPHILSEQKEDVEAILNELALDQKVSSTI